MFTVDQCFYRRTSTAHLALMGVGEKYAVVTGEINPGPGHESRQAGNPEILESKLADEFTNYRFDVINTAVPGNSPFQEVVDLERGMVFDPGVVILQFVLNDVVEPFKFLKRFGGKGIDYHGVRDEYWLDRLFRQNSAFYLFLADSYRKILESNTDIKKRQAAEMAKVRSLDWGLAANEPKNDLERQLWTECLKQMQSAINLARDKNIPFLLFVSPVDFQLYEENDTYAQQRLKELARLNNVSYFDILPVLGSEVETLIAQGQPEAEQESRDSDPGHLWRDNARKVWESYFLDYDHYNARGHEPVADQLYPIVTGILFDKHFASIEK
ncbi:hypothetical protein ACFL1S_02355 [Pseudomonadota bacterium]